MLHIHWFLVVLSFAAGLSMCVAHTSSHCKAQKLHCHCGNGRYVRIKVEQCRSDAGLCQPCEGNGPISCNHYEETSNICSRPVKVRSPSIWITYFEVEGNHPATLGAAVNLTCHADALQGVIAFQKSGKIVYEDQRITYFQLPDLPNDPNRVKTTLQIKNLTSADGGTYDCVVISATGLLKTKSLTLTVLGGIATRRRRSSSQTIGCVKDRHVTSNQTGPPHVTINAKAQDRFVDDTIIIKCTDLSNPPANITWLFDGESFSRTRERRYSRESCNEMLIINHAETSDTGNFTCIATNEYGKSSESALVKVHARHRETDISVFKLDMDSDERYKAFLGGSVNITCRASNAHFIVFHDPEGRRVHYEKGRYTVTRLPTASHVVGTKLEIKNVTYEDAGNYTCEAIGQEVKVATLLLRIEPCPKDHFCPLTANRAFRCPDGTCNDGHAPVAHKCHPCAGNVQSSARRKFPVELVSLIVLCALLFLLLVIVFAAYLRCHRRRSETLGRVGSSSDHRTFITNAKPLRLQQMVG